MALELHVDDGADDLGDASCCCGHVVLLPSIHISVRGAHYSARITELPRPR
jgi:hypothetical protein